MNNIKKNIWMCWFQGKENIPNKLNKVCINKWESINKDCNFILLDNKNIFYYVPEFFDIVKNSPSRTNAAKSDLLRILLLSKFGGVWVDASVYPMLPLNHFYGKIVNESGFFTYRYIPRGGYGKKPYETVSWFICSKHPNNYLIDKLKDAFLLKFKSDNVWEYFTFHETLTDLFDKDINIRNIIDNMVQINQDIPHSAYKKKWESRVESYVYKRPNLPTNLLEQYA